MGKLKDHVGNRYGNLTVIADMGSTNEGKKSKHLWLCRCDCGNEIVLNSKNFAHSNSCGCMRHYHLSAAQTTHGGRKTRLFNIWVGMRNRCEKEYATAYKYYGIRGISVCDEWQDFATFRDWALNNGYASDLTIDRIDNDGNYEPSNCRWVTRKIQNNNRRYCHLLTYNGETHNMMQWSEITGIGYDKIRDRINRYKWPVERALTTE